MENETQTTLRDTISNAFDTVAENPVAEVQTEAKPPEVVSETSDRSRDDKGRFEAKTAPATIPTTVPVENRPPRPSSWKKDYWDHWDKLDPALASYLNEREQQFATGVSTYKREYDNLKPIVDTISRFNPQEYGMNPLQFIEGLGSAHQSLVKGTPEQKLSMFLKLANDYQVPVQNLFTQGDDGKVYFNPQVQAPPQAAPDVGKLVQEKFEEYATRQQVEQFAMSGKYPHLEQVRETMAGLLRAGLADDLPSAYDAALRHPRHNSLFQDIQKQDEEKKRLESVQVAAAARAKQVSTKSSTPGGAMTTASSGLRGDIESAFDKHAGRV